MKKSILCILIFSSLSSSPTLSKGGETLDLGGGYLFGAEDQDPHSFNLQVLPNDCLQIVNGYMLKWPLTDWYNGESSFNIIVDGELVFGEGFPSDPYIFAFEDSWHIEVNGSLRVKSQTTQFQGGLTSPITISDDGSLILEENARISMMFFEDITSYGTIILGPNSELYFDESEILGNGNMTMEAGSFCNAAINNQTIDMHAGSTIWPNLAINSTFILPTDGKATIRPYSSGASWGVLRSCEIVIPGIPEVGAVSDLIPDENLPLLESSVSLLVANNTNNGSENLILSMNSCSQDCGTNAQWNSIALNPPPNTADHSYILRWGQNGLYALTAPADWCEADLNFDRKVDYFDVAMFLGYYTAQSPWANLSTDQAFNIFDVLAYVELYAAGCP